jgi:hypothetical protein
VQQLWQQKQQQKQRKKDEQRQQPEKQGQQKLASRSRVYNDVMDNRNNVRTSTATAKVASRGVRVPVQKGAGETRCFSPFGSSVVSHHARPKSAHARAVTVSQHREQHRQAQPARAAW